MSDLSARQIHLLENILSRQSGRQDRTCGRCDGSSDTSSTQADRDVQLPPFAQILSTLQQLQQSDSAKYQQVTQQIATDLLSAKSTLATVNSSPAAELEQLSNDFTKASQTGQLPDVRDLAMAFPANRRPDAWSFSSTDGSSDGGTSTDSTTRSSARAALRHLIQSLRVNLHSDSRRPMSIITKALSGIGLTSKA